MELTRTVKEFLEKIKKLGSVPGLKSIRRLLELLGNPQNRVPAVHVAGTNGKGSVCCYLGNTLSLAGFRTGVYTSPAVFDERERYAVNGVKITEESYWRLLDEIRLVWERMEREEGLTPTLFEVETALAFLYFAESGCDIAVIETGMGGALDATNVIEKPLCSVFTSIGMDHTAFLGDSLEEITEQKAGIIKEGCDAVSVWQNPEAEWILRETARKKNAPILFADPADPYRGLTITPGLEGAFQLPNSALAVLVLFCLRKSGFSVTDEQICEGIGSASWPGRMERICLSPEIWMDGAHNLPAAEQLRETIEKKFTNRGITYIMGVLADKDYRGMLEELLPFAEKLIAVTPQNPRALPADMLARAAENISRGEELQIPILSAKDFPEAAAAALTEDTDVILVFGSLSYLKDMKAALLKRNEEMSHVR